MEENPLVKADMEIIQSLMQNEDERNAIHKALDTYTNFALGNPKNSDLNLLKRIYSNKFTKKAGPTFYIDPPGI